MSLYSLRTTREGWRIVKFDNDMNIESEYNLRDGGEVITCECPQSLRGPCRHLKIFDEFVLRERINSGWFYDIDNDMWHEPLEPGEDPSPPAPGEVEQVRAATAESLSNLAPLATAHAPDRRPPGISFIGDLKGIRRM